MLLFPFGILYDVVTRVRNWLYDKGFYEIYVSEKTTINIGNLTVGGTGKTPHVDYLIRLLQSRYNVATLSRGYGRKTKGFRQATDSSTAVEIGDEPLQFYKKYTLPVFVCEKRATGLQNIERLSPQTQIVLLDDAFQHRAIKPSINILLTDFNRPFYDDFLLPAGRLREARTGVKRADAIIVSKCPQNLTESKKSEIRNKISKIIHKKCITPFPPRKGKTQGIGVKRIVIFFSTLNPSTPEPYLPEQPAFDASKPCLLLSGIAQPRQFEATASTFVKIERHIVFNDHHTFSKEDLPDTDSQILTTEKDFVKIKPLLTENTKRYFYLPIEVAFLDNNDFENWVIGKL